MFVCVCACAHAPKFVMFTDRNKVKTDGHMKLKETAEHMKQKEKNSITPKLLKH